MHSIPSFVDKDKKDVLPGLDLNCDQLAVILFRALHASDVADANPDLFTVPNGEVVSFEQDKFTRDRDDPARQAVVMTSTIQRSLSHHLVSAIV